MKIWIYEIDIIHTRIGIRNHSKHLTTLFWLRYETFFYFFEFKVFRHEEKETHFFTMLTVRTSSALNSLNQPTRGHPVDPNWSGLAQIKHRLHSSIVEFQLTVFVFFSNPTILSPSLWGMTSFTSAVSFSIWGFYHDICDCHILPASTWTPALNECT